MRDGNAASLILVSCDLINIQDSLWDAVREQVERDERVVKKAERLATNPTLPAERHVARLGDIASASNRFEIYHDYGLQMRARSRAAQPFLVQLAGPGTYAPTERSVAGGGYGARPESNEIGPAGARRLVEWTVAAIHALWE